MKDFWIEKNFAYDGSQLRSLFAYLNYSVQGDSIVAWQGPCHIPNEHMVDGEDLLAGEKICGDQMLHFIVEKFNVDLFSGVGLQRLLAAMAKDLLVERCPQLKNKTVYRDGDDIYVGEGKLSISIATKSPVSCLIHFAMNITNEGTPVQTACLGDLGVDALSFAKDLMARFVRECEGISSATTKVKPVG